MLTGELLTLKVHFKTTLLSQFPKQVNSKCLYRAEVPFEDCDILSFLKSQRIQEQYFWADRDGNSQIGGIGSCIYHTSNHKKELKNIIKSVSSVIQKSDSTSNAFVGFSFLDAIKDRDLWGNFGAYIAMIPVFEIIKKESTTRFAFNVYLEEGMSLESYVESWFSLLEFDEVREKTEFKFKSQHYVPEKKEWTHLVDSLRSLIETKKLHKAVLARQTTLTLNSQSFYPQDLLHDQDSCYRCFFRTREGDSFISVSPERLFLRKNKMVLTEAIAGTRPRHSNVDSDIDLENELMASFKDAEEHQFVLDMIKEKLYTLCDVITETSSKTVLKLNYAQHLYFSILGMLKDDYSDSDIVRALHPTPAVGGFPTKEAVDYITLNEPFDRGWYSGGLVLIEKDKTEAIVGIRSALLKDGLLHLFSGAGIVDKSIASLEWDELNTKIIPFLSLFK